MTILKGGYTTYGEKIGILMLDTKFPRPVGDMGNAETWSYPVKYKVVKNATVKRVVKEGDPALIPLFIEKAKEFEEEGISAITTNCGFMALFQKEIQAELNVPFFSSNLMQIPFVYSLIGGKGKIGVLTARKETLTTKHFEGAGVYGIPLVIEGMDDALEFNRTIIEGHEEMDLAKMEDEIVQQARKFVTDHDDVEAIVLECTNLTPYVKGIKQATQLPVFDIVSMVSLIRNSLP